MLDVNYKIITTAKFSHQQRWIVEDLVELLSDAVKYIVIEERLFEPLSRSRKMRKDKIRILHCKQQHLPRRPIDLYSTLPHY